MSGDTSVLLKAHGKSVTELFKSLASSEKFNNVENYLIMDEFMKNIVIVGGSGARSSLKALEPVKDIRIQNIVTMFDSGGSTGYLRRKYGIYAIGDLRDRILAVSKNEILKELSEERIEFENVANSVGNLIFLSALNRYGENYLDILKRLYETPENIDFIPITSDIKCDANLVIKTNKGTLNGEASIDSLNDENVRIEDISLDHNVKINPKAYNAISKADYIVFGPGDIYASILPNTLVDGFYDAMKNFKGKTILVTNIMRHVPETTGYNASDFIKVFEKRGIHLDDLIVNNKKLNVGSIKGKYTSFSGFIDADISGQNIIVGDFIKEDSPYEHDPDKLRDALVNLISR